MIFPVMLLLGESADGKTSLDLAKAKGNGEVFGDLKYALCRKDDIIRSTEDS